MMKQILTGALCLATTVTLGAQTARTTTPAPAAKPQTSATMDKAAMEQQIIDAEKKINDAVAKGNVAAFKALASDGAWSVDEGGPMSILDFEKNFAQIKIEPGWTITDSKIVWSDTNTAVHFYKWTGKGTFMGQPVAPVTYSSTVWNKRGGKWIAVFHQESRAAK